ncbi:hypothetical protein I3842_15G118600 [Carya illinoinensis]|uniref:Uncharacterized protein n=1 Tax=Carya illinoinensis TaxID=32201 RepID=A0A922D7M4_CARIL|nr:hypothetical protein I3842_15G118600 [Carya illinoinensis]
MLLVALSPSPSRCRGSHSLHSSPAALTSPSPSSREDPLRRVPRFLQHILAFPVGFNSSTQRRPCCKYFLWTETEVRNEEKVASPPKEEELQKWEEDPISCCWIGCNRFRPLISLDTLSIL